MQHMVVIPYQHFGTTYQSHLLDHSRWDSQVAPKRW